jgi:hypothetical protein
MEGVDSEMIEFVSNRQDLTFSTSLLARQDQEDEDEEDDDSGEVEDEDDGTDEGYSE